MEENSSMQELRKDVSEIKQALIGSPYTENKGLVNTVADQQCRIEVIEERLSQFKWLLIGLSFGSGLGASKILSVVVDLLTKK